MLRLIKPEERLEKKHISLCVYGLPDTGKTSLAFTANKPLLIDFDGLVEKIGNEVRERGEVLRSEGATNITSWEDVKDLTKRPDFQACETFVIDTAGRAVDLLAEYVKQLELSNRQGDGRLSIKGWGVLKDKFEESIEEIEAAGKDLVLLVHLKEERKGEENQDRLDIEGGSRSTIYKTAFAICRIVIQMEGKTQKRFLDFSPRLNAIGKNPGRLGLIPYDDPLKEPKTLAIVLQSIKDYVNKPSAKQAKAATKQEKPAAVPKVDDGLEITRQINARNQAKIENNREMFLADVNPKMEEIKKQPTELKQAIHNKAKALGLRYNPRTNFYERDPDAANGKVNHGATQGMGEKEPVAAG